jgi:hypothetical protein
MGFKPFKFLRALARIGRPLLRLLGVKKGTVADKAAEGLEILVPLIPPDTDSPTASGDTNRR